MRPAMLHCSQSWSQNNNASGRNVEKHSPHFVPYQCSSGSSQLLPQTSAHALRVPGPSNYKPQQYSYYPEDRCATQTTNNPGQYINPQNMPNGTRASAGIQYNQYNSNVIGAPVRPGEVYNQVNQVQPGSGHNNDEGAVRFLESSGFQVDQQQAALQVRGEKEELYLCLDENDLMQNPTLNTAINNPSMLDDILSEYDNQMDESGFSQAQSNTSLTKTHLTKTPPAKQSSVRSALTRALQKVQSENVGTYNSTQTLYVDSNNIQNMSAPPQAQANEVRTTPRQTGFCRTRELVERMQRSCSCPSNDAREEVPVIQVFMQDGQMYRLPETNIISLANIDFYAFVKESNFFISLALFFREMGFDISKMFEKEIMSQLGDIELRDMGENEQELMRQKCQLSSQTKQKDLINIADIRNLSNSILKRGPDNEIVRELATGVYYQKLLSSCEQKCSQCGLLCRPAAEHGEYVPIEIIYPESEPIKPTVNIDSTGVETTIIVNEGEICLIPYILGKLNVQYVSLTAFKLGDKTYISLKDIILCKLVTLKILQMKMSEMQFQPITAPKELEQIFKENNFPVTNTLWIEIMELRCCIVSKARPIHKQQLVSFLCTGQYKFSPEYTICCQTPEPTKKNIVINNALEIDNNESVRTNIEGSFPFLTIGRTTCNGRPMHKVNKNVNIPHLPVKSDRQLRQSTKAVISRSPDTTTDVENLKMPMSYRLRSSTPQKPSEACGSIENSNRLDSLESTEKVSRVGCKKVLSAFENQRHLEPFCTQQTISYTQTQHLPNHSNTKPAQFDGSDKENVNAEANMSFLDASLIIDEQAITDNIETVEVEIEPADSAVSSSAVNVETELAPVDSEETVETVNSEVLVDDLHKQNQTKTKNQNCDTLSDKVEVSTEIHTRADNSCEANVEMEDTLDKVESVVGDAGRKGNEVEGIKLKPGRYIVTDRELFHELVQNNKVWVDTHIEEVLDTEQSLKNSSHKDILDKHQSTEIEINDKNEENQTLDEDIQNVRTGKENDNPDKQNDERGAFDIDTRTDISSVADQTKVETDKTVTLTPGKYIVTDKDNFAKILQERRVRLVDGTVCQAKWLNECKKDRSAYEFHRHLDPACTQPSENELTPSVSEVGKNKTEHSSLSEVTTDKKIGQASELNNSVQINDSAIRNCDTNIIDNDKPLEESLVNENGEGEGNTNSKNIDESLNSEGVNLNKSNEVPDAHSENNVSSDSNQADTEVNTPALQQSDERVGIGSNISYNESDLSKSSEHEALVSMGNDKESSKINVEISVKSEVDSYDAHFVSPQCVRSSKSDQQVVTRNSSVSHQSLLQSPPLYTVSNRASRQSDFDLPITSTPIVSRREPMNESLGMASRVNRLYTKIGPLNNSNSPDVSLHMLATIATADADSSSCDSDLCDPEKAKLRSAEKGDSAKRSRDIIDVARLTEEKQKMLNQEKKALENDIKKYLVFKISKDNPPKFSVEKFKAGAERVFPVLFFPDPNHPKVVKKRKKFMLAAAQYLENLYMRHKRERIENQNLGSTEKQDSRNSAQHQTVKGKTSVIQTVSGKKSENSDRNMRVNNDTSGSCYKACLIDRSTTKKGGRPKQQTGDERGHIIVRIVRQTTTTKQKSVTAKKNGSKLKQSKHNQSNKCAQTIKQRSETDVSKQTNSCDKELVLSIKNNDVNTLHQIAETKNSKEIHDGQKENKLDSEENNRSSEQSTENIESKNKPPKIKSKKKKIS